MKTETKRKLKPKKTLLGFVRLSIVDPLHGMQPLKLKKHEHLFLVFNGEIYNYLHLKEQFGFEFETNCDTEVILHLYAIGEFWLFWG